MAGPKTISLNRKRSSDLEKIAAINQHYPKCVAVAVVRYPEIWSPELLLGLRADGQGWGMAGGKIEEGETDYAAAQRELFEEFGIAAEPISVGRYGPIISGMKGEPILVTPHLWFVDRFDDKPKAKPDEVLQLDWFSLGDLIHLHLFPSAALAITELIAHSLFWP